MKYMKSVFLVLFATLLVEVHSHIPTQTETVEYQKRLDELIYPKCLSIPEGVFVYYFHPKVGAWLEKPFSLNLLLQIENELKSTLEIPFTKEGFTQAVPKPEGDAFGEVSYNAIWVRDCCWHYYGLKINNPPNAERLMLSLLKFYSTDQQVARFLKIIETPQLADPDVTPDAQMNVPLTRFSSKTLSHHQAEGEDQEWNHIQFDSHGLFLLALADALSSSILKPDQLTVENFEMIALFPAFFTQTNYAAKKDSGPWEEGLQLNAYTAGVVAAGLKRMMEVVRSTPALNHGMQNGMTQLKKKLNAQQMNIIESAATSDNITRLYNEGLKRVEKNLSFGGEAPNLDGKGIDRKSDAALMFLGLVEHSLFFDQPHKIKEIIQLVTPLIGPYGIYRYKYDPYQSANYWIVFEAPSPISGPTTPQLEALMWWKKGYMPHKQPYDAQWFFDSCLADLYYHLSIMEKDPQGKAYYLKHGDIHLKRALAQLTGTDAIAANGEKLEPLQLPESINTVFDSYYQLRPLPSPISPLSWSKAALQMALTRAKAAHGPKDKN